MAMRFQRKVAGRCKGVRELQEREVPFSVGGGASLAAGEGVLFARLQLEILGGGFFLGCGAE